MVSWSRELIPHDFLALAMSETSLQLPHKLVSQACHEEVGVIYNCPSTESFQYNLGKPVSERQTILHFTGRIIHLEEGIFCSGQLPSGVGPKGSNVHYVHLNQSYQIWLDDLSCIELRQQLGI